MSEENLYTFENPEYRKLYWHSCSHVMAQAVQRVFKDRNVKFAIGPAIKNGFYYLAGDNQTVLEGPVPPKQIFAVVTAVCRKGQWFKAEDPRWQFFAIFWRRMLHLRPIFLFIYTKLSKY